MNKFFELLWKRAGTLKEARLWHPVHRWYQFFSSILSLIFVLSLWQVSACSSIFISFTCAGYSGIFVVTLLIGIFAALIGLSHAKDIGRPGYFFKIVLGIYGLGTLLAIIQKTSTIRT